MVTVASLTKLTNDRFIHYANMLQISLKNNVIAEKYLVQVL